MLWPLNLANFSKNFDNGHKVKTQASSFACIRLERGKFELTYQDSAGGKSSSVLM